MKSQVLTKYTSSFGVCYCTAVLIQQVMHMQVTQSKTALVNVPPMHAYSSIRH